MSYLLLYVGDLGKTEILIIFFFLSTLLIWGYALVEIVTSTFEDSIDKVVWLLLVLMVPVLGIILYFLVGRRRLAK